jgi:hypothetical protein
MKKVFFGLTLSISFFLTLEKGFGQIVLSGPTCVVPNTVYQYTFSGKLDSSATLQVCLTGGVLADTPIACSFLSKGISFFRVIWNAGTAGSIHLKSNLGNASMAVAITYPLTGGSVSSLKTQSINFNSLPGDINCQPATGGSCSPIFAYQWQESLDIVSWKDITGATNQNLNFTSSRKLTVFFRRKVTEKNSGSIAYSDVATVDAVLQIPAGWSQ